MKRFLETVKDKAFSDSLVGSKANHSERQVLQKSSIGPVTTQDVTRYRYHHGCNLGSVFVQERWLTPGMFTEGQEGSSELACAENWVKHLGIEGARQRFEQHWRDYVSDGDLDWLRDFARCTTVRLPVGFYDLGPNFCQETAFKQVAPIYQNAWRAILDLMQRCHTRGIGVLIDMHALPGGANGGEHSGTNSGKAEFYSSKKNFQLATECICFIAQNTRNLEGVAGIQIVNEAEWHAPGLYDWYGDVLTEVSRIDPSVPIYISDGCDLRRGVSWSQSKNSLRTGNPVVVDTHLYWCFTNADQQKSPQQITGEVWTRLGELDGKEGSVVDRGAAQVIIGEYSCALGDASWAKGGGEPKEDLARQFGNAQSQRYQQRAGGSFFWTYRMDWMDGGEWGFKQMTNQQGIVSPASLTVPLPDIHNRIENAQGQRDFQRGNAWRAHCQWWDTKYPGEYEHWRFEAGWSIGWNDALAFFEMRSKNGHKGGDKIGMLELWVLKRLQESGHSGSLVWEFEHGLRKGVRDFYECVGI